MEYTDGGGASEMEEDVYDTSNSTISLSAFETVSNTGTLSKEQKQKLAKKEKVSKPQKKPQRDTISKADFQTKLPEFRKWLQEEKCLDVDKLADGAKKDLFKKFVKKWNSKKLPKKYYIPGSDCWTDTALSPSTISKWTLPPATTPATPNTPTTPNLRKKDVTDTQSVTFSTFGKREGRRYAQHMTGGGGGASMRSRGQRHTMYGPAASEEFMEDEEYSAWRAASLQHLPTTEQQSSLLNMRSSGVSGSVQSFVVPPRTRRNTLCPPPPPRRDSRLSASCHQLSKQVSDKWKDPRRVSMYSGGWTVSPNQKPASDNGQEISLHKREVARSSDQLTARFQDVSNQEPIYQEPYKITESKSQKNFLTLPTGFRRTTKSKAEYKDIKTASIKMPKISRKAEALKENFVVGNKRSADTSEDIPVPDSLKGLFCAPAEPKKAKLQDTPIVETKTPVPAPLPKESVMEGYVTEGQNLKEDKKAVKKREKEKKKQEKVEQKEREKEAKRQKVLEKQKAKEDKKKQKDKKRLSTGSLEKFRKMSLREEKKSEDSHAIPAPPPPPPPPPPPLPHSQGHSQERRSQKGQKAKENTVIDKRSQKSKAKAPPTPPPLPANLGQRSRSNSKSGAVGPSMKVPPTPPPLPANLGQRSRSDSKSGAVGPSMKVPPTPPPLPAIGQRPMSSSKLGAVSIMREAPSKKLGHTTMLTNPSPLPIRKGQSSRSNSGSAVTVQGSPISRQISSKRPRPTPPPMRSRFTSSSESWSRSESIEKRSRSESTEIRSDASEDRSTSKSTEVRSRRTRNIPSVKMPRDKSRSRSRAQARSRSRSRAGGQDVLGTPSSCHGEEDIADTPPPPPFPNNPSKSSLHEPLADYVPPPEVNNPPASRPVPPPQSTKPAVPQSKPVPKSKPLAMKKIAPRKPPRKSLTPRKGRQSTRDLREAIKMEFDDEEN